MKRVLVVDKLSPFLAAQSVRDFITPTLFSEADGVPRGDYHGLIPVVTTMVGAQHMDHLPNLQIIANYGVGHDNVDLQAARARGIAVSNTPGVLTDATAELTIALILATARRLGEGERLVRAGKWTGWTPTQLRGNGLKHCTLGIVGAGRIGRAVGTRAAAGFAMNVVYWSRTRHEEWERASGACFAPLTDVLSSADIVTIHLARTSETRQLIDAAALARMRDGAILVNTSRGAIVDEDALIAELTAGRLRAGLDVYAEEPNVRPELLSLENVVLLPHLGSATWEARQEMWNLAWQNLVRGVTGKPLLSPVT